MSPRARVTNAPPTPGAESDLLRPVTGCDRIPTCAEGLFAPKGRHQGRDEAWDFERAPVNATKGGPEANRNYVATVSGASFFRVKRLRHDGPLLSHGALSSAASLTR